MIDMELESEEAGELRMKTGETEETCHTKPIVNHRKKISSLFLKQRFSQWQFGNTAANIYI